MGIFDGVLLAGFLLFVMGIGLLHVPAAIIAAGILLMSFGLFGSYKMSLPMVEPEEHDSGDQQGK